MLATAGGKGSDVDSMQAICRQNIHALWTAEGLEPSLGNASSCGLNSDMYSSIDWERRMQDSRSCLQAIAMCCMC